MLGEIVKVTVDRPLGSYHPNHSDLYYPINYGYIEGIIAPDGEEQDAYILGVDELVKEYTGKVIAIIHRYDDVEEKWVVAPENVSYTREEIMEQVRFQEQYFDSEVRMLHEMKLKPNPFNLIKSGKKTIELRLYDEKRQTIDVEDWIRFTNVTNEQENLHVKVKALHRFKTFEELYNKLPLLKCGYTEEDVHNATPEHMNKYYSKELQVKYGVVGIEIEMIDDNTCLLV